MVFFFVLQFYYFFLLDKVWNPSSPGFTRLGRTCVLVIIYLYFESNFAVHLALSLSHISVYLVSLSLSLYVPDFSVKHSGCQVLFSFCWFFSPSYSVCVCVSVCSRKPYYCVLKKKKKKDAPISISGIGEIYQCVKRTSTFRLVCFIALFLDFSPILFPFLFAPSQTTGPQEY